MHSLRRIASIVAMVTLLAGCAAQQAADRPESDGKPPARSDFRVLGREDAPVTLIEFTDLQCPYCARFALQTFPQIKRDYVDTGKLRYASRDLPLGFHPFAKPAAVASRCAGEQGRYWDYRESLFRIQGRLGKEPYDELAERLGLDRAAFSSCRADPRKLAAVEQEARVARAQGIAATPSFVLGRLVDGQFVGEQFSGAKPYADFAARIDALLEASQ
ncbi:MAG TPA: DsbA family protein [Steroidobacteraceae bacterium]|nr:DsbA family protein [Steroidobacteraceae bacterium]